MDKNYEQSFCRATLFFGEDNIQKLHNSTVTVVGMGAVGSFCIEALVRSGVGHFRLFDFDEIRRSNINRQLFATEPNLGRLKVEAARERILSINPSCKVDIFPIFVSEETMGTVIGEGSDLYIDAIDSVNPKTQLLFSLKTAGKLVISSMGAARKSDPLQIRVSDISKTKECLLARHIRQRLRRRGIEKGIPCVYSMEKPVDPKGRPVSFEIEKGDDFERGREREPLPSLCHMTGIMGLTLANLALEKLLEEKVTSER